MKANKIKKSLFGSVQAKECYSPYGEIIAGSAFKLGSLASEIKIRVVETHSEEWGDSIKCAVSLILPKNREKTTFVKVDKTCLRLAEANLGYSVDPSKVVFFQREYSNGPAMRIAFREEAILNPLNMLDDDLPY